MYEIITYQPASDFLENAAKIISLQKWYLQVVYPHSIEM